MIMKFKYAVNEWPPLPQTLVLGLEWFTLVVPIILILGKVIAGLQYPQQPNLQFIYLQKLFFITGVVFLTQLTLGHKLPIIAGPAAVLMTGIIANATNTSAVYSSIMVGGVIITLLSACGLLSRISKLFTQRIIGCVLLLIAFTMLPTILGLLTTGINFSFSQLVFSSFVLGIMFLGQRYLPRLLKSTIIVWTIILGSILYYTLFPFALQPALNTENAMFSWKYLIDTEFSFTFDIGVLISFLLCFVALIANDVGSIQTTAQIVNITNGENPLKRGLIFTGIGNILAGLFGVIGPVNFSLSAGVILSSRCASRYTLMPAAIGIIILAFVPIAIQAFLLVPNPVIGILLLYLMCSQAAGGFGVLKEPLLNYTFEGGLIIGVSILLGTITAFLPSHVVSVIPVLLRPLLANGFVVGITAAIFLEYIFTSKGK